MSIKTIGRRARARASKLARAAGMQHTSQPGIKHGWKLNLVELKLRVNVRPNEIWSQPNGIRLE